MGPRAHECLLQRRDRPRLAALRDREAGGAARVPSLLLLSCDK